MASDEISIAVKKVFPLCKEASGSTSGSGRAKMPGNGDFSLSFKYYGLLFLADVVNESFGFVGFISNILLGICVSAGFPLSKAGDMSTSLGMMPRLTRLNIPSRKSLSSTGGGSAKGLSLKCFGIILLGLACLKLLTVPMPSFSSSTLEMPP